MQPHNKKNLRRYLFIDSSNYIKKYIIPGDAIDRMHGKTMIRENFLKV